MMNRYYSKCILPLLLLAGLSVCAQDKAASDTTFTGLVRDPLNVPLAGVTVEVQEKDAVTTTDANGKFTIEAAVKDVLIFRKTGYLTDQQVLGEAANVEVFLALAKTDAAEEDDVEIPFGTRKKRNLTAAITSVKTADLPQVPVSDVKNIFSGRVPGLYLNQTGTQPGNDGTGFEIRGRSSYGSVSARALVDGVQRDFADMDLNEIESITVLKDAAALAWYGFRGGNGVVLIKTKSGSATRSGIRFDSQVGFQTPENLPQPLNSYEYATLYNEALSNDGSPLAFDQAALDAYRDGTDPFRHPDNQYVASYLKRSTPVQRYVLSADGGNSHVRYFALFSYLNQVGLFKDTQQGDYDSNTGYKRFNFRGNVDFNVNPNLTITLNAGGRAENRLNPGDGTAAVLNTLYNLPPNAFPILNKDGTYGGTTLYRNNPLGQLRDRGYTSAIDRVLLASFNVRQKLDSWTKGLSASLLVSYDANGTYVSGLDRDYAVSDLTGDSPAAFRNETPLSYRAANFTTNNRRNEVWAGFDYDRTFGSHAVNASVRAQRAVSASPDRLDNRSQGLSARLDYGYRQKYLLGLVAGYSGSENFGPGRRYGFFPAVSAGWIVSEEGFLQGNPLLSYLKLRASHGQSGNDQIGGARFPFETFYNRATTGGYTFGTGFSSTNTANESNLGNPGITWETITTTDVGVEAKFFRNALAASVDLYQNRRADILTVPDLPSILGQNLGNVNAGIVDSKGVDAALGYDQRIGRLTLSLNGNLLVSADRVVAQNGQLGLLESQRTIGRIAGATLVYLSDGILQNQDEVNNSPRSTLAGRGLAPGDIRYRDIDGPDGQPDGIIDELDFVRINQRDLPNTYFGFGTAVRYGLLDFSAQFQGVSGRTINVQSIVNSGPSALNRESLERWTPATAATAKYPRLGISNRGNNTAPSDFWLRDADYVKLKSLEVGLSLPQNLANRYRMQSARLYVIAFNLFTISDLDVDVDPELPFASRGDSYPYLRTWAVGLSVKL